MFLILWKAEFLYVVHRNPPPRALSRAKIIQSTSSRAMWTGLLHYSSIYAEIFRVVLYFIFTHQNSVSIFFSLINATCPFPFNLLHVIRPTLKIVDKENKMCSQSLCSLFQAYLLAPSWDTNIFLNTIHSMESLKQTMGALILKSKHFISDLS